MKRKNLYAESDYGRSDFFAGDRLRVTKNAQGLKRGEEHTVLVCADVKTEFGTLRRYRLSTGTCHWNLHLIAKRVGGAA